MPNQKFSKMASLGEASTSVQRWMPNQPSTMASEIFWLLWTAASAIVWLLPTHSAPWTTFYQEFAAALVAIAAALCALLRGRAWRVDALSAGFAAAALLPLAQAAAGFFNFPTEAPLASFYLFGIALTLLAARRAEDVSPGRLIDALFAGLAIASLVSTGIALCQWLGVDSFGPLLAPMPFHDRPVANVGQPNNLATLLGWGLVAIWWSHAHHRIGGWIAVLAAGFMMIGITLTQSRAGVLEVVLLGAVAFFGRRTLDTGRRAPAFIGLAFWFIACALALEPLTARWTEQLTRPLLDTASPHERTMLLKMVLTAIGQRPWFGYGWNQNVTAHVALADRFPMHGTVANAHNIVLDLMVWTGIPLGLLFTLGLLAWLWRACRFARTSQEFLVLAALGVFAVHTLLELPHVLAYFLLPAAMMIGTFNAWTPLPTVFSVPRTAIGAVLVTSAALMVLMFEDYTSIERNGIEFALQAARIGSPRQVKDPDILVLKGLQSALVALRTAPTRAISDAQLAQFRKAVTRYPTQSGLFRFAEAAALTHRPDDARWALGVLCDLHTIDVCAAAAQDWSALSVDGRPEMAAVVVPKDRPLPAATPHASTP